MTAVQSTLPQSVEAQRAGTRPVDDLVVTAADAAQAEGFWLQLQRRIRDGLIDRGTRVRVVADPPGRRIGSGGATLAALAVLGRDNDSFDRRRAMIVHAGGNANGLPEYAALGRLFAPLPCATPDGQPAALFDLLLANLIRTPAPSNGQVLIASGDVLLTFDAQEVDFSRAGVTGVAFAGTPDRATRHGVYVADPTGRVNDYLQKPNQDELESLGAVDAVGCCAIDTGLMSLDPDAANALLELSDLSDCASEIDLYEEIALALARRVTPDVYARRVLDLPRNRDAAQRARLERLYSSLHRLPFHVCGLSYCDFFHLGTTRELLAGLLSRSRTSSGYGFRNGTNASVPSAFPRERAFVFNSVIETTPDDWGDATILEACHVRASLKLSRRNVVIGLPAEVTRPIELADGVGLTVLPVGVKDWAAISHRLGDQAGEADTRMWPVGPADAVVGEALEATDASLQRKSLADIIAAVDRGRLIEHRTNLQRLGALGRPLDRLISEPDLAAGQFSNLVRTREEAADVLESLVAGVSTCPKAILPRVFVLAQHIRQRAAHLPGAAQERIDAACRGLADDGGTAALGRAALRALGASIAHRTTRAVRLQAAIDADQVVWASAPARIDFAGGWSDTVPICTDRGGCVVNAAISVNGTAPLQAIARLNDRFDLALSSIDRGERIVLTRSEQLRDHNDPGRWDAVLRAALLLSGFGDGDLAESLRDFGGGIDLTVINALPAGSGLGAGSILGAVIVACLARLLGQALPHDQLIDRVSILEQMLTTGGGWQDSVGGVVPGVKMIRTQPGAEQSPSLSWLAMDPAWHGRMLLYYTGLKRPSTNILQGVVLRYLGRDPKHVAVIDELKAGALSMRQAIEARDWDEFGRGLSRSWELKRRLDPGATTPAIVRLASRVSPLCVGLGMPGAGGGGFMLLAARDEGAAAGLRRELTTNPAAPGARFFDFDFDETGLKVSTL